MSPQQRVYWRELTEAADANALGYLCQAPDPLDELSLLLALHNYGAPGGVSGAARFHDQRARQIQDPEWKAAHRAAQSVYAQRAGTLREQILTMPTHPSARADDGLGASHRVVHLAEVLGDLNSAGIAASAWRDLRLHGLDTGARAIAQWLLARAEAEESSMLDLMRLGLWSQEEVLQCSRTGTYLRYLYATGATDAERAEVLGRLTDRVDRAVAHGDERSIAYAATVIEMVLDGRVPAWLQDRLTLGVLWRLP